MLLNEIYNLKKKSYNTKNGKQLTIVYIDPSTSDDSTFANKDKFPSYGMVWLPTKYKAAPKAWGWLLWDGNNDKATMAQIHRFASEVGDFETVPQGGNRREVEEVIKELEELKDAILQANPDDAEAVANSKALLKKIEDFKTKLITSLNSEETQQQLQNLLQYRLEMSKHRGHPLSFRNTILLFIQAPYATDVRSKGEWEQMGYTVKSSSSPIFLLRPSYKTIPLSKAERQRIIANFLSDKGVSDIDELTPSQQYELNHRRLKGRRDPKSQVGYRSYSAYDIKDVEKGENAEEFPECTFDWYDKDSDETETDRRLIKACVRFGESLGITYSFVPPEVLGGARGDASCRGAIRLANDTQNHGMLSTCIHETSHQCMHWTVIKEKNPRLEKFYRGGSMARGTDVIEQEAELCALFTLSQFGIFLNQNVNYLANWGLNETNANSVLDSIADVADFIYNGITKYGKIIEREENENNNG